MQSTPSAFPSSPPLLAYFRRGHARSALPEGLEARLSHCALCVVFTFFPHSNLLIQLPFASFFPLLFLRLFPSFRFDFQNLDRDRDIAPPAPWATVPFPPPPLTALFPPLSFRPPPPISSVSLSSSAPQVTLPPAFPAHLFSSFFFHTKGRTRIDFPFIFCRTFQRFRSDARTCTLFRRFRFLLVPLNAQSFFLLPLFFFLFLTPFFF